MEAPQTLRRPANWQDFESLCKKLWGEIWECPEIQKNGRLGQAQCGVDIFGIPFKDDQYYGIQCKGKSEYTDSQFTEAEILEEIQKAEEFKPKLKKLYFATTALNDSAIQAFVRTINIQRIRDGKFEVHLYCWESIVDLIDENKLTHDWYVKSQKYKVNKNVSVTFQDESTEMICTPKFTRKIHNYVQRRKLEGDGYSVSMRDLVQQYGSAHSFSVVSPYPFKTTLNLSFCRFKIIIHNTGTDSIEEFKLFFKVEGEIKELSDSNKKSNNLLVDLITHRPDTQLYTESGSGIIIPAVLAP
jgi:hypothetical protein